MERLPEFLINKLNKQYGENITIDILNGYNKKRYTSLRINTLKSDIEKVCEELKKNNIEFEEVIWSNSALVIKNANEQDIKKLSIYEKGEIYLQSLSSMLPPIVLEPIAGKDILDMTAAPGGKTTQIAAITNNKANITACEMNPIRADRLKYNIEKQGANVSILKEDSRKLSDYFSFDQILLDAPCSGSGTICTENEKTYMNFSEKLVAKSTKSQLELLRKALKILKTESEMVYSTCSILSEENEDIVNKILKETKSEIVEIGFKGIENIPLLPCKIKGALCVAPSEYYEGFFVAKIRKIK